MALNSKKIISQIAHLGINEKLVSEWFQEYFKLKEDFVKKDWINSIAHCGLFAEYTIGILKEMYDKKPIDPNKIYFDTFFKECIDRKKPNPEDEILLSAVPYAAKTMYTIRNKKKGAHVKAIDPDYVDSMITTSLSDYILAQFVLLKCQGTQNEIKEFIYSVVEKQVPLIEEFDDGTIKIYGEISMPDKILIALYQKGKRMTKNEIIKILQAEYRQSISTPLDRLATKDLVHKNNQGFKITKLGEKRVEEIIKKSLKQK